MEQPRMCSGTKLDRKLLTIVIAQSIALGLVGNAQAAQIDVAAGQVADLDDGQCSIVEAVINANNDDQSGSTDCSAGSAADTLVLPADSEFRFLLADPDSSRALPYITSEVTIQGNNATLVRDEFAATSFGIIDVSASGDLTLDEITISGGHAPPGFSGGGILNFGLLTVTDSTITQGSANLGGGIASRGDVVLTRATVSSNTARFDGGGIGVLYGTLMATNSDIVDNSAGRRGGGVTVQLGTLSFAGSMISGNSAEDGGGVSVRRTTVAASLDLSDSIISGNTAELAGGGIRLEALGTDPDTVSLNVVRSLLAGNTATTGNGGALAVIGPFASASLVNSTLSGNLASTGGGIEHGDGALTLEHITFANNSAVATGDDLSWPDASLGVLQLRSSILDSASGMETCSVINGNLTENLNNLIVDGSCAGNAIDPISGDALLGPLAFNGGQTETHALLEGSAAIDSAAQSDCPLNDQRGVTRSDGLCDSGSFELVVMEETIFSDGFE